jgi:dipeptidyl aminopeptidase/acylaminoacyl peptidase
MTLRFAPISLLAAAGLVLAGPVFAQTPAVAPARGTRPVRLTAPGAVALSPDGTTIAFTLRGAEGTTLHLTDVANPDPAKEKIVSVSGATACSYGSPIWSPDGATLAFISTCTSKDEKPGQEEIFLYSKADGSVKQLTHVVGDLQEPAWSPDGKSIAFLFVENATRSAGALDAMKPWNGVIGEDGVEIQRVYQVDVQTGAGHTATPAKLHVYEFDWAPDSHRLAFVAAAPPGENNWWVAKLYNVPAGLAPRREGWIYCMDSTEDGKHSTDITDLPLAGCIAAQVIFDPNTTTTALHGLQIAVPRFSPDGKKIAFIGGLMSDQGSTGGDLWLIDAKGGQPADITPGIDGTPVYEGWVSNSVLGFVEDRKGHSRLIDWDVNKQAPIADGVADMGEVSLSGGAIKDAVSVSKTKMPSVAFVMSSYKLAPEIWILSDAGKKQITHLNDGISTSGLHVDSLEWKNEGFDVQGWLTYPANYDAAKKYPMIVEVHGGPSASSGPRGSAQWSQLGYFVLQPNPRGSFGQGEKFVQANIKDFGYGDLRDILAGVDFVEKKFPIDDHRLGLTGWSYGGFMSMFAETQTHRFAAIVAGAGISDWKSYYGENSIDQWMVPFFGATVYDDPAVYAKSSAIEFIKNAKTPMLIIVGDRDGECPAPQSFEMWHALKAEGVKTQLVIYPNEGHGFRDPAHIRDRAERSAKWFAEYMPGSRE